MKNTVCSDILTSCLYMAGACVEALAQGSQYELITLCILWWRSCGVPPLSNIIDFNAAVMDLSL